MLNRRNFMLAKLGMLMLGTTALSTGASASDWPTQPVTLVVPFAAGGGTDMLGRLLGEELSKILGVNVLIDNRPGMAGSVGIDHVAKSSDNHTFGLATPGPQITNPFLYASLPYDPENDLVGIIHIARIPNILVVNPDFGVSTVSEFIEYAKSLGRPMQFTTTGPGSSSRLAAELFASMSGIEIVTVPYRGSGPAALDLIAGRVDATIDSFTAMIQHVNSGDLTLLGLSTLERDPNHPDHPTIAETLEGFEASTLIYLVAPASTSEAAISRINTALNEVLEVPEVRQTMIDLGMTPTGGTPDALQEFVAAERQKWQSVIEGAGIRIE